MSVRTDLTIDWQSSPRIIEVDIASTEVTLQDLIDTLRQLEYSPTPGWNVHSYDYIVDASGKEPLGGGVLVGITLRLRNAKIKFADRVGPTFVQCDITGGNLTAIDDVGVEMSPVEVSNYTQIRMTGSSSATLQELEAIQQNVYGEKVTLSATNPKRMSGTVYPAGTHEFPSDNLADAKAIAISRGFEKIHLDSNWTFLTGDNLTNFTLHGMGPSATTITLNSGVITTDTMWEHMALTGILNGVVHIRDCMLSDLTGIEGHIQSCLLKGDLGLTGTSTEIVHLLDCWSGVAGNLTPEIDMNGDGPGLGVRGYNGGILLKNKIGSSKVTVDLNSGQVILDATVTVVNPNDIVLRGIGKSTNNAVNPENVDLEYLLSGRDIKLLRHQGSIWVDTANGTAGIQVGKNGVPEKPVKTLADVLTLATVTGLRHITMVSGNLILSSPLTEFFVELRDESEINFGNQNVNGSEFYGGILKGSILSGTVTIRMATLEDVSGLHGHVRECGLGGTIALAPGTTHFDRCHSHVPGLSTPTLNFVGAGREVAFRAYSGGIQVENMVDVTNISTFEFVAGQMIIDASCIAGLLVVRGNVEPVTDNSNGTTVNTDAVVSPKAIWNYSTAKALLGLAGLNQRIFPVTFDAFGNMTVGYMRIYNNRTDAEADTGHILQIDLIGTFIGINKPDSAGVKQLLTP